MYYDSRFLITCTKGYKLEFNWEKKGIRRLNRRKMFERAFGRLKLYQSESSFFDWSC